MNTFLKAVGIMALATLGSVLVLVFIPLLAVLLSVAGPFAIAIFVVIFPILAIGAAIGYHVAKKEKKSPSKENW